MPNLEYVNNIINKLNLDNQGSAHIVASVRLDKNTGELEIYTLSAVFIDNVKNNTISISSTLKGSIYSTCRNVSSLKRFIALKSHEICTVYNSLLKKGLCTHNMTGELDLDSYVFMITSYLSKDLCIKIPFIKLDNAYKCIDITLRKLIKTVYRISSDYYQKNSRCVSYKYYSYLYSVLYMCGYVNINNYLMSTNKFYYLLYNKDTKKVVLLSNIQYIVDAYNKYSDILEAYLNAIYIMYSKYSTGYTRKDLVYITEYINRILECTNIKVLLVCSTYSTEKYIITITSKCCTYKYAISFDSTLVDITDYTSYIILICNMYDELNLDNICINLDNFSISEQIYYNSYTNKLCIKICESYYEHMDDSSELQYNHIHILDALKLINANPLNLDYIKNDNSLKNCVGLKYEDTQVESYCTKDGIINKVLVVENKPVCVVKNSSSYYTDDVHLEEARLYIS